MQLFAADTTIFFFLNKKKKNCLQKVEKNILKSCPELPKQKNSCSKLLLIDQLYRAGSSTKLKSISFQ